MEQVINTNWGDDKISKDLTVFIIKEVIMILAVLLKYIITKKKVSPKDETIKKDKYKISIKIRKY